MNKNLPPITVITATYNLIKNGRKEFFKQCLESVHNQTYPNIEHLIIDGASTDGTVEILQEYADKGWIKYISEPDSGIYDAMNKGILKATGKYVAFLNSDDFYYDKQAIHYLATAAQKEQADACYASTKVFSEKDDAFLYDWSGKNALYPPFGEIPNHQTFLIKTEVMKELGLYNLNYKMSADSNFIYNMVKHNKKLVYVDEFVIGFRLGGISDINQQQVLKDQENSFFEFWGNELKITPEEVHQLAHNNFSELPFLETLKLGSKLQKPEWIEEYFSRIFDIQLDKKLVEYKLREKTYHYKLLTFIPLLKIKSKNNKYWFKLFNFLPILKVDAKSYKLFNVLPLISIKGKETRKVYYLFGFLPVLKIKKTEVENDI